MKSHASKSHYAIFSAAWIALVVPHSAGITLKANTSRAQFLSAGAASFITATGLVSNPGHCDAMDNVHVTKNPRYIQKELEMKYADGADGNPRIRGVFVRRVSLLQLSSDVTLIFMK